MAKTTSRNEGWVTGSVTVNSLMSFVFGIAFLLILLGYCALVPNPTGTQQQILLTTLALAAGGVGAMLPGFLEVEHKAIFRAGGALALAALVFFNKPAVIETTKTISEKILTTKIDIKPAEVFVNTIDDGKVDSAWLQIDPAAIGIIIDDQESFTKLFDNARLPLGAAQRRILSGQEPYPSTGLPDGVYRGILYNTKFNNEKDCRNENVVLHTSDRTTWKVFSYTVSMNTVPCALGRKQ